MTDRINALTVVLEADIREDDIAPIVSAIECLRGVLNVTKHVASSSDYLARQRVRIELREKLFAVLEDSDGSR